ncbi:hypothetical protein DW668_07900 [Bacteroides stercoris]|uniref:Uncharacterized protein n=1 Tax=Bacteroides stercoris TaxID=46506 RepID=A0A414Q530_BACSE|nr:hypothetical protein DWV77_17275 [Bacteroides stercoris]RHF75893.1 hypothetical protein DW668_07900 [Bacteroides stercoris]HAX57349.1 hypothetical protein [Bacteroides stercoris]
MPYVFFRPAIAGRIVSSCGLSGPQLATGQPATAKRSFTISITTFYMCPKNKTQHTGQGFASTVLYICQHSRKLLSAKRQLGQCYVSARETESESKETISPFPFRPLSIR